MHKQGVKRFDLAIVPVVLIALLFLSITVIFAGITLQGCGEWRDKENKARSLVKRRASKEEAIDLFGLRFFDYSVGSSNQSRRADFLTNEPFGSFREVRTNLSKFPGALFYSSPDVMMWLFLDESNRVVDFSLSAQ